MSKKIDSTDFQVPPGDQLKLSERPTKVKPLFKSKKHYKKLLEEHVEALSKLQRLHYASGHYALLLIFQGMDAAGWGDVSTNKNGNSRVSSHEDSIGIKS